MYLSQNRLGRTSLISSFLTHRNFAWCELLLMIFMVIVKWKLKSVSLKWPHARVHAVGLPLSSASVLVNKDLQVFAGNTWVFQTTPLATCPPKQALSTQLEDLRGQGAPNCSNLEWGLANPNNHGDPEPSERNPAKDGEFQWQQQQQQEEKEAAEQSQSFLISPAHPTYITPQHLRFSWHLQGLRNLGFRPVAISKAVLTAGAPVSLSLESGRIFSLDFMLLFCRLNRLGVQVMFFHWRNEFWIRFNIYIFREREKESMSVVHHKIRRCLGCRHLLVHHLEAPSHLHQAHAFRNEGRPQKCWYKNRIRPHFH